MKIMLLIPELLQSKFHWIQKLSINVMKGFKSKRDRNFIETLFPLVGCWAERCIENSIDIVCTYSSYIWRKTFHRRQQQRRRRRYWRKVKFLYQFTTNWIINFRIPVWARKQHCSKSSSHTGRGSPSWRRLNERFDIIQQQTFIPRRYHSSEVKNLFKFVESLKMFCLCFEVVALAEQVQGIELLVTFKDAAEIFYGQ